MDKPKIAITIGDPKGVGPEIIVKLLALGDIFVRCEPVVYGDSAILSKACELVGVSAEITEEGMIVGGRSVSVVHPLARREGKGRVDDAMAGGPVLMMEAVKKAVLDAMDGLVGGVVTCPINKEGIKLAGYDYPGHTEFIQDLTAAEKVVMMLAGERLKVALVTIHISLRDALSQIGEGLIFDTIKIVWKDFVEKLGVWEPKIAVSGLNPHAGEGGLFGSEEKEHILPAVERARKEGMDVSGPYPPDTIFYRAYNGEFHVVIAMYHDQGLIPLKLVHFDTGVNVTLGLPLVRTSVDHGTAYDIAWKGIARPTSLHSAVNFALTMMGDG
jgi:4-hydroxythreonine-4-phosphate dehydrogenase